MDLNLKFKKMKHFMNRFKAFLFVILIGVTFASCTDSDETLDIDDISKNTEEVALSADIDAMSSAIGDFVIEIYESEESSSTGRLVESPVLTLPDCVTVTVVAQQGFRVVTVDFGSEGCLVRGHVLKGQLVFSYTRDVEAQQVLITYSLEDFFYDAKNILGNRTILRERSNVDGNPQFTHNLDFTIIWPNGTQASRSGTKIREWVEGFTSGVFTDNVFEVRGNWTTTFINGNTHAFDVVLPLRREVTCAHFVSGSIDIQRTNFGGLFDYGDGSCDNKATFTFNNGNQVDITLN